MQPRTHYEVLKVPRTATEEEIRAAYRSSAWNTSGDETAAVNEAYATLSNPDRRRAYDESLAAGVAPPIAVPVRVQEAEEPEESPGLRPHLRLWGWVNDTVWGFVQARYYFVSFRWIFVGFLLIACGWLFSEYAQAAEEPNPTEVTIGRLIQQMPSFEYITVRGVPDYETRWESRGNNAENYYALVQNREIMFFTGKTGLAAGRITGRLRPFEHDLRQKVTADAKDPFWEGYSLLTTHYLDTRYQPKAPGLYLGGLGALLGLMALLIIPSFRRYTVFTTEGAPDGARVEGALRLPLTISFTGAYRSADGRKRRLFLARAWARLLPAADGGFTVETVYVRGRRETVYEAPIPPGSGATWGYDWSGGRPHPCVAVEAGGQKVYLRVDSLREARVLANQIQFGA